MRIITQIRFSIAIKASNTNMILIIGFERIRKFSYPCRARVTAQTTVWWSISLVFWNRRCFYGYEKHFSSLEDLEQAIVNYINYYNNKRIKVKLKGHSSVQYRTKSFGEINCLTFGGPYKASKAWGSLILIRQFHTEGIPWSQDLFFKYFFSRSVFNQDRFNSFFYWKVLFFIGQISHD